MQVTERPVQTEEKPMCSTEMPVWQTSMAVWQAERAVWPGARCATKEPPRASRHAAVYLALSPASAPMTDDQNAHLAAYGAVEAVLDAHPAPLDTIPAAGKAIGDFRDRLGALRRAVRAQAAFAPQARAKDQTLTTLADAAVPLSQTLAVWAEDTGDVALADQIAFTRTDFTNARDQDALDRAALVQDTAEAHLADLGDYLVTKGDVEALDALVKAFAGAMGQPRHAVGERVAQTRAIETLFPEIGRLLDRRLDRHVERFRGTPFYDEYHAARRVVSR